MSISHTLLGLLEGGPRHGYDLKRAYDERFGQCRSVAYGQIYSTLSRLRRDGLVELDVVESGEGPERKRYAITEPGVRKLEEWLSTPEEPAVHLRTTVYSKVVLAVISGRGAHGVVAAQRRAHLEQLAELTTRMSSFGPVDRLVQDYAVFHIEADLRWLEAATARLDEIAKEFAACR